MVNYWYEVDGREFDTIEATIDYCNEHGFNGFEGCGSGWDTWKRCEFCGEFFPDADIDREGLCSYCTEAIRSHGG